VSRRAGPAVLPVGCGPHDHLSWPYLGSESWRGAVKTFLQEGQDRGERLLYVTGGTDDGPVDLEGLRVLSADAPERLGIIERLVEETAAEGHPGVRIAAETSTLAGDGPEFARYEMIADGLMARTPLVVMCGYDLSRVAPRTAALLDFVHPLRRPHGYCAQDGMYADGAGGWWLTGVLDLCNIDFFELALSVVPPTGDVDLHVSGLRFCDAAAAQVLVRAAGRRCPAGRFVLHGTTPLLRRVLDVGWPGERPGLVLS
jgi:hypothetical protein